MIGQWLLLKILFFVIDFNLYIECKETDLFYSVQQFGALLLFVSGIDLLQFTVNILKSVLVIMKICM